MIARRTRPAPGAKRSRLGLIRLLLALDIMVLLLVVYDAPVLRVARVRVSGTHVLAPQDVVRAAALDGEQILALDPAKKVEAIQQLHWVKSAVVERRLPSEVWIRVVERRPAAVWATAGGQFLVDDEGMVLGEGSGDESLVRVIAADDAQPVPGRRLDGGVVAQAQQLVQLLPQAGIAAREIVYERADGLTVLTAQGWKARFGGPEGVAYKIAVLKELVPIASRHRFELIDLRSPDRPYIR